jgi:hypothetical protein
MFAISHSDSTVCRLPWGTLDMILTVGKIAGSILLPVTHNIIYALFYQDFVATIEA